MKNLFSYPYLKTFLLFYFSNKTLFISFFFSCFIFFHSHFLMAEEGRPVQTEKSNNNAINSVNSNRNNQQENFAELETYLVSRWKGFSLRKLKYLRGVMAPQNYGEILEKVNFPSSNIGLRLKLMSKNSVDEIVWALFEPKDLGYKFFEELPAGPKISNAEKASHFLVTIKEDYIKEPLRQRKIEAHSIENNGVETAPAETLEMIENANTDLNKNVNNCDKCKRKESVNKCVRNNSYIEKELLKISENDHFYLRLQEEEGLVAPLVNKECVSRSLENMSKSKQFYRQCSNNKIVKVRKPCLSQTYVNTIKNSFDLIGHCFKDFLVTDFNATDSSSTSASTSSSAQGSQGEDISIKESMKEISPKFYEKYYKQYMRIILAILMQESGLHINAVAPNDRDWGIGQLQSNAIADINNVSIKSLNGNTFNYVKSYLSDHKTKACNNLGTKVLNTPLSSQEKGACERISIENGNPLKNIMYSMAYSKVVQHYLNKDIFLRKDVQKAFSGLSLEDQKMLKLILSLWAHNTGAGGLAHSLIPLVRKKNRFGKKITNIDTFLEEMAQSFKRWPHRRINVKSATHYYSNLIAKINYFEKNLGGSSKTCIY